MLSSSPSGGAASNCRVLPVSFSQNVVRFPTSCAFPSSTMVQSPRPANEMKREFKFTARRAEALRRENNCTTHLEREGRRQSFYLFTPSHSKIKWNSESKLVVCSKDLPPLPLTRHSLASAQSGVKISSAPLSLLSSHQHSDPDPSGLGQSKAEMSTIEEGGPPPRKKTKTTPRASIACQPCRGRKIRCTAEWPVCGSCKRRKVECSYLDHPAKNLVLDGNLGAGRGNVNGSGIESPITIPLPPLLHSLLSSFSTHFIHTSTFTFFPPSLLSSPSTIHEPTLFAILALGAIYSEDEGEGAEKYGDWARELIKKEDGEPSLELVQTHLLLAMLDCILSHSDRAWLSLGLALRLAQILRLPFPSSSSSSQEQESRKRTFWSIFLLDRLLSNGRTKPRSVGTGKGRMDLRLPVSENAWVGEYEEECTVLEGVETTDLQGWTLRAAEIYSEVLEYIMEGGHQNCPDENPWEEDSTFGKLDRKLKEWKKWLPSSMGCMKENLERVGERAGTVVLMHILYNTALLFLHRDWLPFLPKDDTDFATGPPGEFATSAPEGWWANSTKMVCESADSIVMMMEMAHGMGIRFLHPFAGFAVMTAGTIHLQQEVWPHTVAQFDVVGGAEMVRRGRVVLEYFASSTPVSEQWLLLLSQLHAGYAQAKTWMASAHRIVDSHPLSETRANTMQLLGRSRSASPKPAAPRSIPVPPPLQDLSTRETALRTDSSLTLPPPLSTNDTAETFTTESYSHQNPFPNMFQNEGEDNWMDWNAFGDSASWGNWPEFYLGSSGL